jgi:predicted RNA-binding Zn-ribbon protein involved in translation (DUF1610 family)
VANWQCETCMIVLDAADEGEPELCPRCGEEMTPFTKEGNCLKEGARAGAPASQHSSP